MKRTKKEPELKTFEMLEDTIGALQINNIFLKSCSSDCITGPGASESGGINIVPETTHTWSLSQDKKFFVCFATMKLNGIKNEQIQFKVEACFALAYDVLSSDKLNENNLALFSRTNAVYNAYPYFGEFFQNALVRMGLPPLQLPLLKPLTKKQLESSPAQAISGM